MTPKNVDAFPWRQRHGPVLRAILMYIWSRHIDEPLSVTMLQWAPDEFAFREFAFAALCLAAGDKHLTVMPDRRFSNNGVYGYVKPDFEDE